jgi:hypothetical protein
MKPVASSILWMGKPRRPRQRIVISLGKPERDPLPVGDYRCLVKLPGVPAGWHIYGMDSLQALVLALAFINSKSNSSIEPAGASL